MLENRKIAMIGGGKMGGALIQGMVAKGLVQAQALTVADRDGERLRELARLYGVGVAADNREAARRADLVILAVKPQNMEEVLAELSDAVASPALVVSIAAGISSAFLEERLPKGVRVVRVMPNLPAVIGEGATAVCAGVSASQADLELARRLFSSFGITVDVPEALMDAVTGLSGSGPGYAFLILEALTEAGVRVGLDREAALTLSAQSLLGAAKLCLLGERPPAELKAMVASPGGTTLAGLRVLEEGRLRETLISAVEAASRRSAELGGRK